MARPTLSKEEKLCAVCKVSLEESVDRVEIIYTKELDPNDRDKVIKFNRISNPCYCWKCPQCGSEVTITK